MSKALCFCRQCPQSIHNKSEKIEAVRIFEKVVVILSRKEEKALIIDFEEF